MKLINVGVERGVATRMAQVVWPMMIVPVTNFEGFSNSEIFAMWILGERSIFGHHIPSNWCPQNLSQ